MKLQLEGEQLRPVEKGSAPTIYSRYKDAGPDLCACLGDYCSYCERQIETNLAVEHVQPKSLVPSLQNIWGNFLLACVNCNSSKGNTPIALTDYLWPDVDNTLRAFVYVPGGIIRPHTALNVQLSSKAEETIQLIGLDRYPGNPGRTPTPSDRRWLKRQELWQIAERDRERLRNNNTLEVRELIVESAVARGMFSIWWTVFAGDVDMRRRLREAFRGTDVQSFDANENLQLRAGGQV